MHNSELAKRMKKYEEVSKTRLMTRQPVIVRIDGRAFHTLTKGFCKPFDLVLIDTMQSTMKYLCENIQGCVLGYTQSDEISLLLTDYKKLNTSAFFDYEVQKLCSVTASMATLAFNMFFEKNIDKFGRENIEDWDEGGTNRTLSEDERKILYQCEVYHKAKLKGAMFDCRVFNLPFDEVTNYFYWRQDDAVKNSVQMVARYYFPHKELYKLNNSQLQEKLFQEKGVNWNDYPIQFRRGSAVKKFEKAYTCLDWLLPEGIEEVTERKPEYEWRIDRSIPIFKGDGRQYIEELVNYREE